MDEVPKENTVAAAPRLAVGGGLTPLKALAPSVTAKEAGSSLRISVGAFSQTIYAAQFTQTEQAEQSAKKEFLRVPVSERTDSEGKESKRMCTEF